MKNILMYTSSFCPYCAIAERLLSEKGFDVIEKIHIDQDSDELAKMIQITGKRTVPQIFIDKIYIGGNVELQKLEREGKLDSLK